MERRNPGAADVPRTGGLPAAGLSGGVCARRQRPLVRRHRHCHRTVRSLAALRPARARLRHRRQPHAAGDPLLRLHGADPRTLRHGRGPARHHRPAVRLLARRPRLRGDPGRRPARRHHRRGRRHRHRHGPDLAAGDAALRLRQAAGVRRHRRLRHAGADRAAVPGADRAGRPARRLGRRHVQGCLAARPGVGRAVSALCTRRDAVQARTPRPPCRRPRAPCTVRPCCCAC